MLYFLIVLCSILIYILMIISDSAEVSLDKWKIAYHYLFVSSPNTWSN